MQASFVILIFFSLTTDMNRASQNLRVPAVQRDTYGVPGVCACSFFFLLLADLLIPFRLQSMATLKEDDQLQMWEFIRV
jgi:hypothetical protein